jgi:hypothetical protein
MATIAPTAARNPAPVALALVPVSSTLAAPSVAPPWASQRRSNRAPESTASGRREESFAIFFIDPIGRFEGERKPSIGRSELPADEADAEPTAPEGGGACLELASGKGNWIAMC